MQARHIAAALLALSAGAHAQLNKCTAPDGRVTYSDRGCAASQAASAVKAPPIAEPTERDRLNAEIRRAQANLQVAAIERQREIDRARAPAGPVGMSTPPPAGLAPDHKAVGTDDARCRGIQRELRRGRYLDPLNFDRTLRGIELQRQEKLTCG